MSRLTGPAIGSRCMRPVGFLLLIVFLLAACAPHQTSSIHRLAPVEGQALLTTYLSTSGSSLQTASFTIDRIDLYHNAAWSELALPPVQIDSKENRKNQLLLGVALAPVGEHRRLRLQLKDLKIDGRPFGPEGQIEIVELTLPEPVYLKSKESQCLFLNWTLESPQGENTSARLFWTAWGQRIQLGTGLAYIACRDIGTIYILRTDTNDLVAAFAVSGPIGEIQIDPRLRRLYIMSSGSRSIFVYDCIKARMLEQIFLPGTEAPEHFVMDIDGHMAYVTDAFSGQVLKVDLTAGTVVAQQRVGHRLEKIALLATGSARLAVVSPKAQQITILTADSLAVLRTFSVGQQVKDLRFLDEQLYVVEQSTNTVAIYEYQTGRLLARIPVGFKPTELLAVDAQSFYVSNQGSDSLSSLMRGQKTSFRRIPAGLSPAGLALSTRHQSIYVLSPKKRSLSVVNLPSEFLHKTISLGGSPNGISILD